MVVTQSFEVGCECFNDHITAIYEQRYEKTCFSSFFFHVRTTKAHPRSLISAFVFLCLDTIIPLVSRYENSRIYLASVAAQASLSLL